MPNKGCCRECKYADWDADGCTCMIDGFFVCDASEHTCDQYRPAKPMTNADRIRQMTDEELVEFLMNADANICDFCDMKYPENCLSHSCEGEDCKTEILKWLKQEVSEDAGSKTD
ncbi:MAG: hypothetical protein IIU58_03055 [Clostridia bacterium]|nr:hypothetical protein [Clostridia bacterium]